MAVYLLYRVTTVTSTMTYIPPKRVEGLLPTNIDIDIIIQSCTGLLRLIQPLFAIVARFNP